MHQNPYKTGQSVAISPDPDHIQIGGGLPPGSRVMRILIVSVILVWIGSTGMDLVMSALGLMARMDVKINPSEGSIEKLALQVFQVLFALNLFVRNFCLMIGLAGLLHLRLGSYLQMKGTSVLIAFIPFIGGSLYIAFLYRNLKRFGISSIHCWNFLLQAVLRLSIPAMLVVTVLTILSTREINNPTVIPESVGAMLAIMMFLAAAIEIGSIVIFWMKHLSVLHRGNIIPPETPQPGLAPADH